MYPRQVAVENVMEKDKDCPAVIVEKKPDRNILCISIAFIKYLYSWNDQPVGNGGFVHMEVLSKWIKSKRVLKTSLFCTAAEENYFVGQVLLSWR